MFLLLFFLSIDCYGQFLREDTVRHDYRFLYGNNVYDYLWFYDDRLQIAPDRNSNFQVSTRIRLYYFGSWKKFKTGISRTVHHVNLVIPRPI